MRVRCFTQDDAHLYVLPEQIKDEIIKLICRPVYNLFDSNMLNYPETRKIPWEQMRMGFSH